MDNTELYNAVVAIVKEKPNREDLTAEQLRRAYDKVANSVSAYCRRYVLPMELKYTLADMVADALDMDSPTDAEGQEDPAKSIKSIKQGDTTIEFATAKAGYTSISQIVKNYRGDLVPYRSVFWR